MGYARGNNFQSIPINIAGSSKFGIYTKQSTERTFNMTISENWLVPYPGYKIGIKSSDFGGATRGRGFYQSVRLNKMFAVFDQNVYMIEIDYDHTSKKIIRKDIIKIGELDTTVGIVYFAENNKPQILISDGVKLYIYDDDIGAGENVFTTTGTQTLVFDNIIPFAVGEPITLSSTGILPTGLNDHTTYYVSDIINPTGTHTTTIKLTTNPTDAFNNENFVSFTAASGTGTFIATTQSFQDIKTDFTPGYITFHDTYFLCATQFDSFYNPAAQNTWRLSGQNNGFVWPSDAQHIGLLESKSDIIQVVTRFPSRGNMILVMGKAVTEFWFDTGNQLFPYQRQNQSSIDYGCVSPATVAFLDDIVVWLGQNEKSGPIVMYTTGGEPKKITTDGIDFQLSQINNPEDSQGFIFRKNGHLFYHLNFYTDNFSYVFDLTSNQIYEATDENGDYYIMGQVVWYQNQYFSISRNTGNLYIFDTVFNKYEAYDSEDNLVEYEVPRSRITENIRLPSQDYFVINDIGFIIETGESDYIYQNQGPIYLLTEDGNFIITEDIASEPFLIFENSNFWETENGLNLIIGEVVNFNESNMLISDNDSLVLVTPRVDLSVSYDGGATFGSNFPYQLPHIGKRRNKLIWWNLGMANDAVFQFNFWNTGPVVADGGLVNIRK